MSARKDRSQPRVRLHLEQLENRELLNGSFEELGTSPLVSDLTRLHNDLDTSTIALVKRPNRRQPTRPPCPRFITSGANAGAY